MPLIDVKAVEAEARKKIVAKATETATAKLMELYERRDKAALALRNCERDIERYLAEISDMTTYEAAGVDTTKKE